MAYDAFQHGSSPYGQPDNAAQINPTEGHPSSFDPPYPYQATTDQINMPQPQVPPAPAPPQGYYPEPPREQTSWPPPPPPSQPGRINEAVSSAVGSHGSSSYISPELVAQVTANVLQQLSLANNQQQPQSMPPPPQWGTPQPYQNPGSPHTPVISHTTSPPPPATYQPPPPQPEFSSAAHLQPRPSPTPPQDRRESPTSQVSDHSRGAEIRPKVQRGDTFLTPLEKIWGKLFEDGKPTERLGQFLRGVATHLIENYPPGNTLVVVPEKLQKFYADTNIPSDPYPWQDIFDDRTSSISRLFREVEAEHHLVQVKLNERPDIPGLTPRGFEVWATLMIQAHPDKEYERLQKAVLNMPISNPDNRKERFPKEIPRRLFPETPNLRLREEVDQYIMKHCGVDLPPITDEEIKKVASQRHKSSASPNFSAAPESNHSMNDRERKPYQPPSAEAAIDDDDEEEQSPPAIERKRKPYSAQPGGGKVYDGPSSPIHRHANSFSTSSGIRDNRPAANRDSPPYRNGSRGPGRSRAGTATRSRSHSRGFHPGHEYRHSEGDLLNSPRNPGTTSSGDYYHNPPSSSNIPSDLLEQYRELDRSAEDQRLYEQLREREKEREKSKYHDSLPSRSSWAGEEDYYRGLLGGQGGGPSGSGYDYKSYR
ncbi:uncharacterized protein BJX67DRAFT_19307 [Aspergillus lucknowensis]|uniref:DUF7514 domain-containing protein n=1 Tax=Aspergillus lucknowensis TaxID=176173 RepID=A0ABR4M871_9EURO